MEQEVDGVRKEHLVKVINWFKLFGRSGSERENGAPAKVMASKLKQGPVWIYSEGEREMAEPRSESSALACSPSIHISLQVFIYYLYCKIVVAKVSSTYVY